jgi:Domain of unknown function (DUF4440)
MDEQLLLEQIERLDAAFMQADYERIRWLVSPHFMMVNPLAQRLRKDDWLAWLVRDIRYHRIERTSPEYRLFTDAAIVTADVRSLMSVVGLNGGAPSVHHTYRTEVWVESPSGPMLEHVHLTRIDD